MHTHINYKGSLNRKRNRENHVIIKNNSPHILSSVPILIMPTIYIQDIKNTSDSHSMQHEETGFRFLSLHDQGSNEAC